jgi:hypothetical protein
MRALFIAVIFLFAGNARAGETPDPVVKKICRGTCSGKMAWVQGWNDAARKVQVYQYQGGLDACSHPPQIFYDLGGKELGAFPEFPVNTQDPASMTRLKELQAKRDGWLKGLSSGKKWWCSSI